MVYTYIQIALQLKQRQEQWLYHPLSQSWTYWTALTCHHQAPSPPATQISLPWFLTKWGFCLLRKGRNEWHVCSNLHKVTNKLSQQMVSRRVSIILYNHFKNPIKLVRGMAISNYVYFLCTIWILQVYSFVLVMTSAVAIVATSDTIIHWVWSERYPRTISPIWHQMNY